MLEPSVAVVGGGPAGLSAAGALKRVGLDAVIFDRDHRIGGSWLRRYERLRLHTIRSFSGLAHFPMPSRYPRYVPKDLYAAYLQEYARKFELDVQLGCNVTRVSVEERPQTSRPAYVVQTDRGARRFRTVVVATGMFADPIGPTLVQSGRYRGTVLHSSQYFEGRRFAGKRVLVIGLGNTGAEIAADLAEIGASFVAVAVRTAPPVVPRDFLGTPVQLFGIALSCLPAPFADRIGSVIARVALGDLTRYGLRRAQWAPFSARRIPVIDVGFARALKSGRISIRPAAARLSETGVTFEDGREEIFDVVIFATGYATGLERFLAVPGVLDENNYPRFQSGVPTSAPGLYFIGFVRSHRGHLFEIDVASRRLARSVLRERL